MHRCGSSDVAPTSVTTIGSGENSLQMEAGGNAERGSFWDWGQTLQIFHKSPSVSFALAHLNIAKDGVTKRKRRHGRAAPLTSVLPDAPPAITSVPHHLSPPLDHTPSHLWSGTADTLTYRSPAGTSDKATGSLQLLLASELLGAFKLSPSTITVIGLALSHPAACAAAAKFAHTGVDTLDTQFIADYARSVLGATPGGYIKSAGLCGSIFGPGSGDPGTVLTH
ncbi:hypothetical protein BJ138DRAFT_1224280 [Hygrophoropsis aurantiaca]|uniref:Uncharacterized protein n=1 Tax=Hygrophoropsis aurantiaca TaxID=72124 RepID=A0ACB7ZZ57_9AGAM|nr:hypothetical protein BJ138DRAFT_1224280 [Hygrophoropsis aurantiaca]